MYFETLSQRCDGFNSYSLSFFIENNYSVKQKYSLFISQGLNRKILSELLEDLVTDGFFGKEKQLGRPYFLLF